MLLKIYFSIYESAITATRSRKLLNYFILFNKPSIPLQLHLLSKSKNITFKMCYQYKISISPDPKYL